MRNYQHKYDPARELVAAQINPTNVSEIAEWCGGRELGGRAVAIEVPVQGGASSVIASEGDFVILDAGHEFYVRSERIFNTKYQQSETQDEELEFDTGADVGQEDEHGIREDEGQWIENRAVSGETEDAAEDRLQ